MGPAARVAAADGAEGLLLLLLADESCSCGGRLCCCFAGAGVGEACLLLLLLHLQHPFLEDQPGPRGLRDFEVVGVEGHGHGGALDGDDVDLRGG